MNWVIVKQPTLLSMIASALPELNDGGISFAEGRLLMGELSGISSTIGAFMGKANDSAFKLLELLNFVYQLLFFGSFLAIAFSFYARLTWKSGLSEAIYFPVFIGNVVIIYLLIVQLNTLCGCGSFRISAWAIACVVCGLASEILWEEASFNTPNPFLIMTKESEQV